MKKMTKSESAYRGEEGRAKSSFERYCRHIHDLHDMVRVTKPTKSGGKYGHMWVLQLTEQCRMTKKQGQECVRVVPQDKGVLAELLNIRNSEQLGVPPGEDFVLLDHRGVQIAMVLRNRLAEEVAEGWGESRQYFRENSVGWAGGCQAAPYPKAERIKSQLKSSKAATSCGIADTMVVTSVGPEKEGAATGVKVQYINGDGESKSFGIGPWVSLCLLFCSTCVFHMFKIASSQFNSFSILLSN